MTVAYQDFVTAFPEFSNQTTYPQGTVEFWIGQAYLQLSPTAFGTSLDLAVMLFTAHNIVLAAQSARAGASGGVAGSSSGIVASKAVADVSVSYDTTLTAVAGAGIWNATSYGQRLFMMLRAFASGPYYRPGIPPRTFGRFGYH
jgi:hypothetical protein